MLKLMNTTAKAKRGQIITLDLLIASIIIFLMFYVVLLDINENVEQRKNYTLELELQRTGMYILDTIIKNGDSNNAAVGAAKYDAMRKRILENELDCVLLKDTDINSLRISKNLSILEFGVEYKGGGREIFFEGDKRSNCLRMERFVKIDNKKSKIFLVICSG